MSGGGEETASFTGRDLALWGSLVVCILFLIGASTWRNLTRAAPEPLPILGQVPDFSLTNRDGITITLDDLADGPWVADFVFTRCPAICPRMSQQMHKIEQAVADDPSVRLVSISVDPEHDTPEVLESFARRFSAGPEWYFLTGPVDEISELSRQGFKLALDTEPSPEISDDPIVHSNRFVLVDRQAAIRGYYDPFAAEDFKRLLKDLGRLLKES